MRMRNLYLVTNYGFQNIICSNTPLILTNMWLQAHDLSLDGSNAGWLLIIDDAHITSIHGQHILSLSTLGTLHAREKVTKINVQI